MVQFCCWYKDHTLISFSFIYKGNSGRLWCYCSTTRTVGTKDGSILMKEKFLVCDNVSQWLHPLDMFFFSFQHSISSSFGNGELKIFTIIYSGIISIKTVFMMLIWFLVFWWQLSYSFRESGARKSLCPSELLLAAGEGRKSALSFIGASSDEIWFWVSWGSTSVLLNKEFMANGSGFFSDGSTHKSLKNYILLWLCCLPDW